MIRFRFLLPVTLCLIAFAANAQKQQFSLSGYIKDAKTGNPLPYVHVVNESNNKGVISDTAGFFKLSYATGTDVILFSFIGFQRLELQAQELQGNKTILLEPAITTLNEYRVFAEKDFMYDMVANLSALTPANPDVGRTYYTLQSQVDDFQVELVEGYYNGYYKGYDVEEFQLKNGRIALRPYKARYFTSLSTSKAIYLHKLFDHNLYFPSSPLEYSKRRLQKKFELSLIKRYVENGAVLYQLEFKPIQDEDYAFHGTMWIDSTHNTLAMIKLIDSDSKRHPFLPMFPDDTLNRIDLELTKRYKTNGKQTQVQSIDFNYNIGYTARGGLKYLVNTSAIMYAYNFEEPFVAPFFNYAESCERDYAKINSTPYNEYFWESIDEFTLSEATDANENYFSKYASVTNRTLFTQYIHKTAHFLENPFVTWSDKRITFRYAEQANDYNDVHSQVLPSSRYNLDVEIYMDVNQFDDSVHVISQTVFDPYESFYHFKLDSAGRAFINIYFDLVEIERRAFESNIQHEDRTVQDVIEAYRATQNRLETLTTTYLSDTERGRNITGLKKWNQHVNDHLGIDNMQYFMSD